MALSWINGYNNIDYLNKMIRGVENTLSNDYNDLDNIPIIKIVSSTSEPQNIWELKEGMYLIDGIVYVDNNTSYEVSNLFVSMTARLENSKYVLSAFIPFFKGLYEYILKSNSTEYEEHQIVILATHEKMLTRYNETPYEPNGDYNPATKKYVDDKANEIITELDNIGVNKETVTSLKEKNRIRDIKLQALLNETSDRNISISEDTHYFDMPLSIDEGLVRINEIVGDTLVNVCDQEESIAITKSYTVENEHHIALQGEYDGKCRPIVYGNTLVNHNADWDGNLQTGVETSASGIEDVVVEGIKGQEVSVIVEGNTVLNHALGKTSAVVSSIEENLITKIVSSGSKNIIFSNGYVERLNDQVETVWRFDASLFKPNTIYTVYYDIIINTLGCRVTLINNANMGRKVIQTGFVGSESYTFTTSDTPYHLIEGWLDDIYAVGDFKFFIKIYEGDHTTNPKYVTSNNGNYVDLTVANDMSSVVEIEGRTMVNVCDQKDPIAVTKSYTVENSGNHIALQGEYDGKCRPVIQGNTMVNLIPNVPFRQIQTSQGQQWIYRYYTLNQPTKANTVYTLIFDIIENTANVAALNLGGKNDSFQLNTIHISGTGRYIITATSTSEVYDHSQFFIQFQDIYEIGAFETRIMIFEGDLTQTPELIPTEYVEGLKSSFEDGYIPENALDTSNILLPSTDNFIVTFENNILEYKSSESYTDMMHPANIMTFPGLIGGKTYTMVFNSNTNCDITLFYNWNGDNDLGHQEAGASTPVNKGFNALKFDLWEGSKSRGLRLLTNPDNCRDFIFSNFNILEGDWTHLSEEDFNHLGKYKVEYKVTGKNKFDINKYISWNASTSNANCNYISGNSDGSFNRLVTTDNRSSVDAEKYHLKPNTTYTLSVNKDIFIQVNTLEGDYRGTSLVTFTTSSTGLTVIKFVPGTNSTVISNIFAQIEEGTVATEYESYKSYTKTFYLNSPLLEGDTIEDVNGVATHVKRYGKAVLDGSESWGYNYGDLTSETRINTLQFYSNVIDSVASVSYSQNDLICDRFSYGDPSPVDVPYIMRLVNVGQKIRLSHTSKTVDEFKQWLQANPTTVIYKLASPQYEPISTESILCDSYVNGHLDFDSAVPVNPVQFLPATLKYKYLKTNTSYILQFESDNKGKVDNIRIGTWTPQIGITNIIKGVNKLMFISPQNIEYPTVDIRGIGFNASNIVVTEATDTDFDYFEGLSSTYESCYPGGKNLFDGTFIENEFVDNAGTFIKDNGMLRTDYIKIKPNITYTISNSNKNTKYTYYRFFDSNKVFISYGQNNTHAIYCTTPKNAKYLIVCYLKADILSDTTIQVEEGSTATSYEPFIDKYKVDVKVTGKNLFNGNTTRGYFDTNNGCISKNESYSWLFTDYIDVRNYNNLTISVSSVDEKNFTWLKFDSKYRYLGYDGFYNSLSGTIDVSNCSYIRLRFTYTATNLQIEEGTVATSYEPYQEYIKTIYLNSPLLEGDKIVTKNGKVYHYHKMGRAVLDGSRNWWKSTNANGITFMSTTSLFNLGTSDRKILCDSLRVNQGINQEHLANYNEILAHKSSAYSNACYISTQLSQSDFINWLKSNPVTVVYELDTPYYELIDEYNNTILNIPKNVAHLTHTSAVPVNNTTFTNYKDELNVLEPSTQYRVMFDCDKPCSSLNVTLGGTTVSCTSTTISGTKSFLITTPNELVDKNLVIDGIGRCSIDNIRIFKGVVEYGYVKGLWSGYEERKLENIMSTSILDYHTKSQVSFDIKDNIFELTVNDNTGVMLCIKKDAINIKPSTDYTLYLELMSGSDTTTNSIYVPKSNNHRLNMEYRYIDFSTIGINAVHLSSVSKDLWDRTYDLYIYFEGNKSKTSQRTFKFRMYLLEGDWTDNPPTYEEVMANEGKYAVKVKLDTNATIFGKGGRL